MAVQIQRNFPRTHYEAPIQYGRTNADGFLDARMFNFSKGGLYFEPSQPLSPNSDIYIVMRNYSPGTYGPEAYKSYIARIKWCDQIVKTEGRIYGAGVQFLERSHELLGSETQAVRIACDLCGTLIPSSEVCQTEDTVYLCSSCYKHLTSIPEGKLRETIHRFLLGNVI
jgi:hypothetical protein